MEEPLGGVVDVLHEMEIRRYVQRAVRKVQALGDHVSLNDLDVVAMEELEDVIPVRRLGKIVDDDRAGTQLCQCHREEPETASDVDDADVCPATLEYHRNVEGDAVEIARMLRV